ncbi:MAG: sulfotransferase domain-containing protein [Planctomycetes bacterium]|nr:sulfotransferase domain-containing protein [Planctomycetota bacterium]
MGIETELTIVSGLPRSGTSLMMQMLASGGMDVVTDAIRAADSDNPRGYLEYERVKKTKEDPSWIPESRGKVVKMVSSLLYDLPDSERCRVVFMRREIDEVLESQEKMLRRLGRPSAPADAMRRSFAIHLERLFRWLPTQPRLSVLVVNYNRLIADPRPEIERVVAFLDGRPDPAGMLTAIDPTLYRNRVSPTVA